MTDLATLQSWLLEAETAQHRLLTGTKTVTLEEGESRVTYSEANADKLAAYIQNLRLRISRAGGPRCRRGGGRAVFTDC